MPLKNIVTIIRLYIMTQQKIDPRIIHKLADSRPIRLAAKFTASILIRAKYSIEQKLKDHTTFLNSKKPQHLDNHSKIGIDLNRIDGNRFKNRFIEELKKEWKKSIKNKHQ